MFKSLLADRKFMGLLVLALIIKLFSLNPAWVETGYTHGFYPLVSRAMRICFGWIPFSVGDVLYLAAFVFLVLKTWKLLQLLVRRKVKEYLSRVLLRRYLKLVLLVYVLFNLLWGLNYNRQGIANQLGLQVTSYNKEDLWLLTNMLQQRLNAAAAEVDSVNRLSFDHNPTLFRQGVQDFNKAEARFPFLRYRTPSVKASLYGKLGKYFGYTGYYNPFSGEAQLKTNVPVFMKPFVLNHEIAHQLGYAKENEANFVSFLVSRQSDHIDVRYSIYYEMFFYALRNFAGEEREKARALLATMHPRVLQDRKDQLQYFLDNRNSIEPFITGAYDTYLKMNNQPGGITTYNEVIAWLVAYMKKFGEEGV